MRLHGFWPMREGLPEDPPDEARERARKLGPALDAIRQRFGNDAISVATGDPQKATPSTRRKHGE